MALVAYLLFYPTVAWNWLLCRVFRLRHWWDWIDDAVLLGALPCSGDVPELRRMGIGAVVNTCREYAGPQAAYAAAGIEQLRIPTVDFTPPALHDLERAAAFMEKHIAAGRKVYVHCKAGRGRGATVVICYLIAKGLTPDEAQALLLKKRPHVSAHLARRAVVLEFARRARADKIAELR